MIEEFDQEAPAFGRSKKNFEPQLKRYSSDEDSCSDSDSESEEEKKEMKGDWESVQLTVKFVREIEIKIESERASRRVEEQKLHPHQA